MTVSLGLGLTNDCNLNCPHCYRPGPPVRHLAFDDVRCACEALDVGGVNLGTGENGLHPQFREILDWLIGRGLRVSLTSNGHTIAGLPDDVMRALHDVEVSIDMPECGRFDAFRGDGAWEMATGALERCASLGVPTTVLAVLMNVNCRDLPALARLAGCFRALLRVNVYQPTNGARFAPTWAEFWQGVRSLLGEAALVGCTEPVIAAAARLASPGQRCGHTSVRVTPDATVLPCVYWPTPAGRVADLVADAAAVLRGAEFCKTALVPASCLDCEHVATCGGGCASRRARTRGLDRPDPYCPRLGPLPPIEVREVAVDVERLHLGNVCTLLVQPPS